jgi:hypothetical protein
MHHLGHRVNVILAYEPSILQRGYLERSLAIISTTLFDSHSTPHIPHVATAIEILRRQQSLADKEFVDLGLRNSHWLEKNISKNLRVFFANKNTF